MCLVWIIYFLVVYILARVLLKAYFETNATCYFLFGEYNLRKAGVKAIFFHLLGQSFCLLRVLSLKESLSSEKVYSQFPFSLLLVKDSPSSSSLLVRVVHTRYDVRLIAAVPAGKPRAGGEM